MRLATLIEKRTIHIAFPLLIIWNQLMEVELWKNYGKTYLILLGYIK